MINKTVEELLYYAKKHLQMNDFDVIYNRNIIFKLLNINEPYVGDIDKKMLNVLNVPDVFIEEIISYSIQELKLNETDADSLATRILGILSPLPSFTNDIFWRLFEQKCPKAAGDFLYNLSIYNGYIKKSLVEKNEFYNTKIANREISFTINLAKPEKDNKDIKKVLTSTVITYPKCVLCADNVGFAGKQNFPARQNLRDIKLNLDDESWNLQYSPYVYYDHHLIVISNVHEPMCVSRHNISKLFAFVDLFPNYFIGSNSDLPIVGGSILNHEHFQGGQYDMPLFRAKKLTGFDFSNFKNIHVSELDWWNNVLLVEGDNKNDLLDFAEHLLNVWHDYSDESIDLIAHDEQGQHNTLTVIVRDSDNFDKNVIINKHHYCMYISLRNNRTNDIYPDGIFHSHKEHHHIKKEGIGLIEVLGLFVLPARLARQASLATRIANKELKYDAVVSQYPDMVNFEGMINSIRKDKLSAEDYMAKECANMLMDSRIFKDDKKGKLAFAKFVKQI